MFERYSRFEIRIQLIVVLITQNIISVKDAEIKIVMAKTIYDFESWKSVDGYFFKFISLTLWPSIRRNDIEHYTTCVHAIDKYVYICRNHAKQIK